MKNNRGVEVTFHGDRLTLGKSTYRFKGFKFLEVTGKGANALVMKAEQPILGRYVAVKVWLKFKEKDNRDKKKQGIEESRKLSKLDHNNICRIYSVGTQNNILYAVLEYINGQTLKEYLSGTPNLHHRLTIWREIASALEYSYKREVFHGDVHTKNVLIYNNKSVKVLDFGTSFFAGKPFSIKRETAQLIKLAETIFHEFNISDFVEIPLTSLFPFHALRILDYWVEIIYTIGDKNLEGLNSKAVFELMHIMTQAPVFDLELLNKINEFQSRSATYINNFNSIIDLVRKPFEEGMTRKVGVGHFSTFLDAKLDYLKWRDEYLKKDIDSIAAM